MKRMGILLGVALVVSTQSIMQAGEAGGRRHDHRRGREYRAVLPFDTDLREQLNRLYTSIVDETNNCIFKLQHDNERLRQERDSLWRDLTDKEEQINRLKKALAIAQARIGRRDKTIYQLRSRDSRYVNFEHPHSGER